MARNEAAERDHRNADESRASIKSVICLSLGILSVILFFLLPRSSNAYNLFDLTTLRRIVITFDFLMILFGLLAIFLSTRILSPFSAVRLQRSLKNGPIGA